MFVPAVNLCAYQSFLHTINSLPRDTYLFHLFGKKYERDLQNRRDLLSIKTQLSTTSLSSHSSKKWTVNALHPIWTFVARGIHSKHFGNNWLLHSTLATVLNDWNHGTPTQFDRCFVPRLDKVLSDERYGGRMRTLLQSYLQAKLFVSYPKISSTCWLTAKNLSIIEQIHCSDTFMMRSPYPNRMNLRCFAIRSSCSGAISRGHANIC